MATWLLDVGWGYCLRLKKTTYVQLDNDELMKLNQLASVPGISIFLRGVNISKTLHKFPFNVAVHYPQEHHGMPVEEGWFLLTTFSDLNTAVQIYATRFQLEEMFRDFKLYEFNLELTQFNGFSQIFCRVGSDSRSGGFLQSANQDIAHRPLLI